MDMGGALGAPATACLRELAADVRQRRAPILVLRSRTATCVKAAGSLARENRGGAHRVNAS